MNFYSNKLLNSLTVCSKLPHTSCPIITYRHVDFSYVTYIMERYNQRTPTLMYLST